MEAKEYEQLIKAFQEMSLEIDDLRERCKTIERNYPAFKRDHMFIDLSNALFTGVEKADSLADYIHVASDEDWKEQP